LSAARAGSKQSAEYKGTEDRCGSEFLIWGLQDDLLSKVLALTPFLRESPLLLDS